MIRRILIAGGGTGGHLFPGFALLDELRRRRPQTQALFVGTERGVEARLVPARGEPFTAMHVLPLKGCAPTEFAKHVALLPGAAMHAGQILRRYQPDVVVGVGGYASGPMLAAAAAMGVPTALLEQNSHVGLTNRILAPWIGRAYLTFASTAEHFAPDQARVLGNPVRRAFVNLARQAALDPIGFEARGRHIVVLGGSQGAQMLNTLVPEALHQQQLAQADLNIVHQCGLKMCDEVAARYKSLGINAEVTPFIDDIASMYGSAALVIARAGATTLAELCAVGRASILIPYPHAADDHQRKNARALAKEGAAVCIEPSQCNSDLIANALRDLIASPERRRAMAHAARRCGKPDAAAAIVDDLSEWLASKSTSSASLGHRRRRHSYVPKPYTSSQGLPRRAVVTRALSMEH